MEPGEAVIIFTPDSKYTDYFIFSFQVCIIIFVLL